MQKFENLHQGLDNGKHFCKQATNQTNYALFKRECNNKSLIKRLRVQQMIKRVRLSTPESAIVRANKSQIRLCFLHCLSQLPTIHKIRIQIKTRIYQ
jgi:hypothetical protein